MAFTFDHQDANLQAGLRRIAREELGLVLARLGQIEQPEAVHSVRKSLKKTRAMLRLVRTGMDVQPAENAALREVAMALASRRDAAARLITFDSLFPEPPGTLRPLRDHLAAGSQTPGVGLPPDLPDMLKEIRKRADKWSLRGKDANILYQGLTDTRRKAIRAAKAARTEPMSELLIHNWRKRVKDHWYQARLFAPCWPELFKPIVESADRLGEDLGRHHDLSLFADLIGTLPAKIVPPPARRLLAAAIDDVRMRITETAFPASARLFAGDPEEVADLWVDLWRVWQGRA